MESAAQVLLNEVRAAIARGNEDEASLLARGRVTREIVDSSFHLDWSDLLESLGLVDDLIQELNLAIRDDAGNQKAYERLAEIHLDQGQPKKAARVWSELIRLAPDRPAYYVGCGQALEEASEFEKAKEVYDAGKRDTKDPCFDGLIRNLGFLDEPEVPSTASSLPETLLPKPHHLVSFQSLFGGREGVYARQWVSPTGESGYTPVQEALTPKVIENHILGNLTIGIYPIRLDNTVNFVAFDFDMANFAVKKTISNKRLWDAAMGNVHQAACRLLDACASLEIPAYLEDSGFKGRHVWMFLDAPVPAGVAKKFGERLVQSLSPLPAEVTVEVFPKQGSVTRGGLGNLIKLPLGIHKRTGRKALFIRPDLAPWEDQLEFLLSVSKTPRRALFSYIQKHPAMDSGTVQPEEKEYPPWEQNEEGSERQQGKKTGATLPTCQDLYDLDRDPQLQALLARCPTIHAVITKLNRESALTKDETLVLIHTLGHLDHGPEAVNTLFQRITNADTSLFLKSRLRGNPMSCPKIRHRLPDVVSSVDCRCVFEPGMGLYPNPLIHVRDTVSGSAATPAGLAVDSLQFQNLLQEYLRMKKQLREMAVVLAEYEKRLDLFFEETGAESARTPLGELRRVRKEDGSVTFSLEI